MSQTQKKAAESDGETEDREWLRTAQLLPTAPWCLSVIEDRRNKRAQERQGSENRVEFDGGQEARLYLFSCEI